MSLDNQPSAPGSLPNYLADGLPKQDITALEDAREFIDALIEHKQRPVAPTDLPDNAEPVDAANDMGGRPGIVVKQRRTCNDETCQCMTGGEKHGPYKYWYYREDGKLKCEYVENEAWA
jgi:hypothetical protein